MKDTIKEVVDKAAEWPEKYQPGVRRFARELLDRMERPAPPKRFVNTREYGERFGMTSHEVRRLCEAGMIPGASRPYEGARWVIDTKKDSATA